MYKKTITFNDLDGNKLTEDFWFHLSKAKILEMELSTTGGLEASMKELIKKRDGANIMSTFKDLILMSYGERSLDGKRFLQSKEISEAFEQTDAYSELFTELVTNDEAAAEFFNGILPADVQEKVAEEKAAGNLPELTVVK